MVASGGNADGLGSLRARSQGSPLQCVLSKLELIANRYSLFALYTSKCESFGDVIANKINNQCTRNNGQDTSRSQHPPVHASRADGAGHGGGNRFGNHAGSSACKKKFDPGEHKAEERGHTNARSNQRNKNLNKKPRETVAVNVSSFVYFFGYA